MNNKDENLDLSNILWVEKYRPTSIESCILPDHIKKAFDQFKASQEVPNLLLIGRAGTGKTSVARALMKDLDASFIIINGSLERNIDTVRGKITDFATSMSFDGRRKFIIIDEADYLNQSAQKALRNFIEDYSKNCGFIFTANYGNKIIEPLHSRMSTIHFSSSLSKDEKKALLLQMIKRVCKILQSEGVKYEGPVVAKFVAKHFPDLRKTINELQRYSASGEIDSGILSNISNENIKVLIKYLKGKEFSSMREWVGGNTDQDPIEVMRKLYDLSSTYMKPDSIPQYILHHAEYQYKAAFVADQEVNLVAFLTEVMSDVEFI